MPTYYVDTAVGNDANAGTAEGAGNAWATIDKAMNTVVAGDKVWIKNSGNYNEQPDIDTSATVTNPIVFEGYESATGDNGKITIDAQSTRTHAMGNTNTSALGYIFKNMIFTNATSYGVNVTNNDSMWFINCEITNNAGNRGVWGDNNISFINCILTGNSGIAADMDNAPAFLGCIVGNNTGANQLVGTGTQSIAYKNVLYEHTSVSGSPISSSIQNVIANTIDCDNSGQHGHSMTGSQICIDNIIYDSQGYGINIASLPEAGEHMIAYNNIHSNTSGDINPSNENVEMQWQNVNIAPGFNDEAGNDYTLAEASGMLNQGMQPGGIT